MLLPFYALWPSILQHLIWPIVRPVLRFFFHLHIVGGERIAAIRPPIIFAVNHSSELDPIILPGSFPFFSPLFPVFYTSREKGFYSTSGWRRQFYGGVLFKLWGAYPVYTGEGDYEKSLRYHIALLDGKRSVCIFPEGRKTRDGSLGEGKGGVAYLAWRTKVPVMPVRIGGHFRTTLLEFLIRRRCVFIHFGQPIAATEFFAGTREPAPDDFKRGAATVMSAIKGLGDHLPLKLNG